MPYNELKVRRGNVHPCGGEMFASHQRLYGEMSDARLMVSVGWISSFKRHLRGFWCNV